MNSGLAKTSLVIFLTLVVVILLVCSYALFAHDYIKNNGMFVSILSYIIQWVFNIAIVLSLSVIHNKINKF